MLISVKVKTGAKKAEVKKLDEKTFLVAVTTQPEKGKANKAVIYELARYFKTSQSKIQILRGKTSKNKIIQIK